MADDRDWLDKTRLLMTLRFGREPTEDDMVAHFMLCGPDQRIRISDTMDAERGEIGDGEDEMRKAAERGSLRQRYGELHLAGLKAGR